MLRCSARTAGLSLPHTSAVFACHLTMEEAFRLPETVVYACDVKSAEEAVARYLAGATVVGFDIEWRPNFTRGQDNDTAVVQIATENACLVAHVAHMKDPNSGLGPYLPPALQQLLEDPQILKCGVGIAKDLEKLATDLCVGPSWPADSAVGFVDLAVVAKAHGLEGGGLKSLVKLFGHDLKKSKTVSMSNWEAASLASKQIFYAAQDAFAAVWLAARMHRACCKDAGSSSAAGLPTVAEWLAPFVNLRSWSALVEASPGLPGLTQATLEAVRKWADREAERKARKEAKSRGVNTAAAAAAATAAFRPPPKLVKVCWEWADGHCRFGDSCRFSHV